jgi:hypothetical protein
MRKISLALFPMLLFFYGCGSGGGTGSAANTVTPGPGSNANTVSGFTMTVNEGVAAAKAATGARVLATLPTPQRTANSVRIIFRDITQVPITVTDYDDNDVAIGSHQELVNTEIYKKVFDVANYVPGSPVTIGVPASVPGRGYVVDVLTYYDDGAEHYNMLKYGRNTNVNVVAGGTASVTALPIAPTITTPPTVVSEEKYPVSFSAGMPLRNMYKIRQDVGTDYAPTSFATFTTSDTTLRNIVGTILTAPTTAATASDPQTLYLSAQFNIDNSMLGGAKNETYTNWTFIGTDTVPIKGLIPVTFTP